MPAELPLSSVYLTPRAVHEARAAHVAVLRTNAVHMRGIISLIQETLPAERQRLSSSLEDMALTIRWGGGLGLSTDARYHTANATQQYRGAVFFNAWDNGALPFTKAEIAEGEPSIIEVSVRRWDKPEFGARFAEACLGYGRYPTGIISETVEVITESASVEAAMRRQTIAACQEQFPTPLHTLGAY